MRAVKNNGDAINHIPISSSYLQEYLEDEELLIEAAKSMISKEGFYNFYFKLSQEMDQKQVNSLCSLYDNQISRLKKSNEIRKKKILDYRRKLQTEN